MDSIESPLFSIVRDSAGVTLGGEIDAACSSHLEAALSGEGDVAVDTSAVQFMDSSALRVLVQSHQARTSGGGSVRIVRPSPVVVRLLELAGLADMFGVAGTPTDTSAPS